MRAVPGTLQPLEMDHYEFICREGGVSIRYCAEEFENDGSLGATIIKAIKRTMAAEYSRELSNRVFAGKCRMTMRGFHAGGRAAYGLRRMLIDEHGVMKSLLQQGERKFLHTDRTILVPGPSEEVDVVRSIFDQYVSRNMSIASIVRHLNSRRIPNIDGRRWQKTAVHTVLVNEKYIGNSVFNMSSIRLKTKRVSIPHEQWIRARGAFEPIIEEQVFIAAQARLAINLHHFTRFELLDHLTAVWCRHGRLSAWQLNHAPMCPGHTTFRRLFGSLLEAFELVGYRHCSRRPVYSSIERAVAEDIIEAVRAGGGVAEQAGRWGRQNSLVVDGEITISIHLAHGRYKNSRGRSRWKIPYGARHPSDITVLAPFDEKRHRILHYYLVPGFLLANPRPFLFDANPIELEAFKSATLKPLIDLLRREAVGSGALDRADALSSFRTTAPLKTFRFDVKKRPTRSATLLRRFERRGRLVASFVATSTSMIDAENALHRDLACLLKDGRFRSLLGDEGLKTLPALVHVRFWGTPNADPQRDTSVPAWQPALHGFGVRGPLRHVNPNRLRQIQRIRTAFADFSPTFSKLLVSASRPNEFPAKVTKSAMLTRREQAQVVELFRPIEDKARALLPAFAAQAYRYSLTRAYIRKLLSNDHVAGYIRAIYPKIYRRLIVTPLASGKPASVVHAMSKEGKRMRPTMASGT
jgi:hypothetical protein